MLSHRRNTVQAVNDGVVLLIAIRALCGGGEEGGKSMWEPQSGLSRPVSQKKSEDKQEWRPSHGEGKGRRAVSSRGREPLSSASCSQRTLPRTQTGNGAPARQTRVTTVPVTWLRARFSVAQTHCVAFLCSKQRTVSGTKR